jgi:hypothetical protein
MNMKEDKVVVKAMPRSQLPSAVVSCQGVRHTSLKDVPRRRRHTAHRGSGFRHPGHANTFGRWGAPRALRWTDASVVTRLLQKLQRTKTWSGGQRLADCSTHFRLLLKKLFAHLSRHPNRCSRLPADVKLRALHPALPAVQKVAIRVQPTGVQARAGLSVKEQVETHKEVLQGQRAQCL